jgi:S1-C subfamily serine protease
MLVDILIILFSVSAIYRGKRSGFVHQFFSTVGFFGGLFLGSWLQPHVVNLASTTDLRTLIIITTTLGCALVGLTLGEYAGLRLKRHFFVKPINTVDNVFGGVLGVITLLVSVWLLASVAVSLPTSGLQTSLRSSQILTGLNRLLPPAPSVIAQLSHLIDPNGFPDVFAGNEPIPKTNVSLPALGDLQTAVSNDESSVLRIRGTGCGGIVSGSGFVFGTGLVATNAHVVAGIQHPYAQDANGTHSARVVWFDPELDLAVLRVNNLAGHSLTMDTKPADRGTPAAALGYPGGGNFSAAPAAILDEFKAVGHDIYDRGNTSRDVYEIQANIIPGNSGGPLVTRDGSVIGIVFAESTTYNHVGYALTSTQINGELKQGATQTQTVSTGNCAE